MSKVLISRNVFLEKEELNRLMRFISDDATKSFVGSLVRSGGLVSGDGGDIGDNFLIEQGSSYRNIKFKESSIAYDKNGNRIYYEFDSTLDLGITYVSGGTKDTWVAVEYGTTHLEVGTISVSSNGAVSGVGTKFTEIFRGISSLVPNKIKIFGRTPSYIDGGYVYEDFGTYEVTKVIDDTSMSINKLTGLTSSTRYYFSVVGAFSPGTYDDTREEEIYEYDYFNLLFYDSLPSLTENQYLLAKVTVNDSTSTQTIEDLRSDVFTLTDTDIVNRITYIYNHLKGDWDSLIISGCKSVLNFTGTVKTSLDVPSGYVLLNNVVYAVETHTATISNPAHLPYWEIYDDGGVNKARCVYSAFKLSSYYDFNQNYRTNKREHISLFKGITPVFEEGIYIGGVSLTYTSTGKYFFYLNGREIISASVGGAPNTTLFYNFIVSSRKEDRVIKVVETATGSASYLVVQSTTNSGTLENISSTEIWELRIFNISKENY